MSGTPGCTRWNPHGCCVLNFTVVQMLIADGQFQKYAELVLVVVLVAIFYPVCIRWIHFQL